MSWCQRGQTQQSFHCQEPIRNDLHISPTGVWKASLRLLFNTWRNLEIMFSSKIIFLKHLTFNVYKAFKKFSSRSNVSRRYKLFYDIISVLYCIPFTHFSFHVYVYLRLFCRFVDYSVSPSEWHSIGFLWEWNKRLMESFCGASWDKVIHTCFVCMKRDWRRAPELSLERLPSACILNGCV